MEILAHAKINLRHRVFARDEFGFHAVETLLARTSLADTVRIDPTEAGVSLEVSGPAARGVPDDDGNLCWAAADRFLQAAFPTARSRPGVHIRLEKRIPAGTGLGGGSADAAAVLRLLATAWPRIPEADLVRMAGHLGSDVPFALLSVPLALGWERGRRLLPLRPPRPRPALLAAPACRVATSDAYGWLRLRRGAARAVEGGAAEEGDPGGASVLPGATRLADWASLSGLVRNDLEAPVCERHPEIAALLAAVRPRARTAAMTGSGSAVFAIFDDESARDEAREAVEAAGGPGVWCQGCRLPV